MPNKKNKVSHSGSSFRRLMETMKQMGAKGIEMAEATNDRSKHTFETKPTPCEEGIAIGCKSKCCTLYFELSEEDLADGIQYQENLPYAIKHLEDGYCYAMDRKTCRCTIYNKRPKTCRVFDCRGKPGVEFIWDKKK